MALGTRSNFNTLLTQNMFLKSAVSSKSEALKLFSHKILWPTLKCVEYDCGTTIGRVMSIPETNPVGLISLETNAVIAEEFITDYLSRGIYKIRVRDTGTCLSTGGFCAKCGRGYNARVLGRDVYPTVGKNYTLQGSASAYQNYVANSYAGSLLGYTSLPSDPLPAVPKDWEEVTRHREIEKMISLLVQMGLPVDIATYLRSIPDTLEASLAIVAYYGVYGYVV